MEEGSGYYKPEVLPHRRCCMQSASATLSAALTGGSIILRVHRPWFLHANVVDAGSTKDSSRMAAVGCVASQWRRCCCMSVSGMLHLVHVVTSVASLWMCNGFWIARVVCVPNPEPASELLSCRLSVL